jgi:hypothetical protein
LKDVQEKLGGRGSYNVAERRELKLLVIGRRRKGEVTATRILPLGSVAVLAKSKTWRYGNWSTKYTKFPVVDWLVSREK